MEDRQWLLFKDDVNNACDAGEQVLAHSSLTDAFDISTSFVYIWYTAKGTPLNVFWYELDDHETQCSLLNDGKYNSVFNSFDYQFDSGDCCAATCTHPNCGLEGTLDTAFGSNIVLGIGYTSCVDPEMVPITILINGFEGETAYLMNGSSNTSSGTESQIDFATDFYAEDYIGPFLLLDCDDRNVLLVKLNQKMSGNMETVMIEQGANCSMTFKYRSPSWYVNYTVFQGDETTIEINPIVILQDHSAEVHFQRIPDCFFTKLSDHVDTSAIYTGTGSSNQAIDWLVKDTSVYSSCEDTLFLERYALGEIQTPLPPPMKLLRS